MFMMLLFFALAFLAFLAKVSIWIESFLFSTYPSGIGLAEQLFSSNIVALVGGGDEPQFDKSKVRFCQQSQFNFCQVVMWDEHLGKSVAELNFKGTVLNVLLSDRHVVVVLEEKVWSAFYFQTLPYLCSLGNDLSTRYSWFPFRNSNSKSSRYCCYQVRMKKKSMNENSSHSLSHENQRLLVCPAMVHSSLLIRSVKNLISLRYWLLLIKIETWMRVKMILLLHFCQMSLFLNSVMMVLCLLWLSLMALRWLSLKQKLEKLWEDSYEVCQK